MLFYPCPSLVTPHLQLILTGRLDLLPVPGSELGQMFGCPYALSGVEQLSMNALRVAYVVIPCIASFSFIIQVNLN